VSKPSSETKTNENRSHLVVEISELASGNSTGTNAPWRIGGVPEGILQLHVDGQT